MASARLIWSHIRVVLMVISDWAFGTAVCYVAFALFQSNHLGISESHALAVAVAVYVLNRAVMFARIIGKRSAKEDRCAAHTPQISPVSPPLSASPPVREGHSDRDLDTTPPTGRRRRQ